MADLQARIQQTLTELRQFLHQKPSTSKSIRPSVSLFTGAGLGDLGYELAGFHFGVQAELDQDRVALCEANFPQSTVITGKIAETTETIIRAYQQRYRQRPAILSATPPCQGMSSSNPGRGKRTDDGVRDERNRLLLDIFPVVRALQPRLIVIENVVQVFQEMVDYDQCKMPLIDALILGLTKYSVFSGVVQMADYGIPQIRKRAIIVAVHRDEPCLNSLALHNLLPWPKPTHAQQPSNELLPWISLSSWFHYMNYASLDAIDEELARCKNDQLHFVPSYTGDEYLRVADIPASSGRNAYQNANCRACGFKEVSEGVAHCDQCGAEMTNRPYVRESNGTFRLIKGFHSSYRRMAPESPARTITTASSHVGSDYKIHPWENRVLSVRECADLQSVPRSYNWSWALNTRHSYVIRQVIGEAIPSRFTYLHGGVLQQLLDNTIVPTMLAQRK